jgi:predicted DNA-binding transcriptional regulator YafY
VSGPTVDPASLTTIAGACRDSERLRFAYRARDETETRRLVEPHSLVNIGRRWYLVAWDCNRSAWRTFRIDRLARPSPAGARFAPRKLPGGDPAAFVTANLSSAPSRYQARVTLYAPAPQLTERFRYLRGQVEAIDEQRSEYRTSDDSLDWLAMRIGMLGVAFEVHEPAELVERFEMLAARFARAGGAIADSGVSGPGAPAASVRSP